MVYLSPNFKLPEFTKSFYITTDSHNIPDASSLVHLTHLCVYLLEPLRRLLGKPIIINSGYRNTDINKRVKGVVNSQHLVGEAVDIRTDEPYKIKDICINNRLPFDQMILHSNYVHLSFTLFRQNRGQVFDLVEKTKK